MNVDTINAWTCPLDTTDRTFFEFRLSWAEATAVRSSAMSNTTTPRLLTCTPRNSRLGSEKHSPVQSSDVWEWLHPHFTVQVCHLQCSVARLTLQGRHPH